eukprot:CAMPEP_0113945032 /NCGR_PEP_ID=MMETSP1339-20121228/38443_1 /TAXON_ID=94617 /ORGANISM="Fibrocapsa japonica" /LENGTH=157 /DNA_ID=CAMNT_0000950423 /DNA_START=163 /DNA_END=636 /DNA_ORIENTATION=- /assembly_acc=CAM_ASM_000762
MKWCENSCSIQVPASALDSYNLYSQLEKHPTWSPWLDSVKMVDSKESVWTLSSKGVTLSWRAVNTVEEPGKCIQWESITGVPNKGKVTFTPVKRPEGTEWCQIELTVSYDIPGVVAKISQAAFVSRFTEETLMGDLKRFKTTLAKEMRKVRRINQAA